MTAITPYCKIGSTVLTSYLKYSSGLRAKGGNIKTKKSLAPGQDRSWLSHQGREPKVWDLFLAFPPGNETAFDNIMAVFDDSEDGDEFYAYDAARFYRLAIAGATVADPIHSGGGVLQQIKARVECELPVLFANTPTSWAPGWKGLETTDPTGMVNTGKIDAPLYSLALQAVPAGAGQFAQFSSYGGVWKEPISVTGDPNRYIVIRYRLVTGDFNGADYVRYKTSSHEYVAQYQKLPVFNGDGNWHTLALDMWSLDAGGTDWKDNTITGVSINFVNTPTYDMEYFVLAEDTGAAATAVVIYADDWSLANITLDDGEPEDLTFSLMNGAIVDGAISLAHNLMGGELLEMDVLGQIMRTYTLAQNSISMQEQIDTDCTVTGTVDICTELWVQIHGDPLSSCIWKLDGPWPLSKNVLLEFEFALFTGGLANLQISTDSGSSWTTLYTSVDFENVTTYKIYLAGSKGHTSIWIRFITTAGGEANGIFLRNIVIKQERYVPESDIPVIGVGDTRKIKIDDSNDTIIDINATWRNRWRG